MKNCLLEMKEITKIVNDIRVLNNFSLSIKEGETHTVITDSEASMSAIIKILSGDFPSSSYIGDIIIMGRRENFNNIKDSEKAGIGLVRQKPKFVPEMKIWENIFLGSELTNFGFIDQKRCITEASIALKKVGLDIDANIKTQNLTTFQYQRIEMARLIIKKIKIWIFEDLISVLTDREIDELLELLKTLKDGELTFIYIGHKLKEILQVSDMITFVRDGKAIFTEEAKNYYDDDAEMSLMIGKELTKNIFIDSFCDTYNISKREKEVLIMLLNGKNNREICSKLCLSINTIKTHISNIYQKTGVNNRVELVKLMLKYRED